MLLESSDLDAFRKHIDKTCRWINSSRRRKDELLGPAAPATPPFMARHPHLLLALGFDEYRAIKRPPEGEELTSEHHQLPGIELVDWAYPIELMYREVESGVWAWLDGFGTPFADADSKATPESVVAHFIAPNGSLRMGYEHFSVHPDGKKRPTHHAELSVLELFGRIEKLIRHPEDAQRQLSFCKLWTPNRLRVGEAAIQHAALPILQALLRSERELDSLHWTELEDLVAHLLIKKGMKVSATKRTRDGGRDIIARGELIPGEPTLLAVEVKHKEVCGLHDLQRAMRANEDFPALLMATSGRFSAGVLEEKHRERNALRLFLKDGLALNQWIHSIMPRMTK